MTREHKISLVIIILILIGISVFGYIYQLTKNNNKNIFKFNKRSKINMIFIPTKISYYLQHYNIKIKLIKEKQ